MDNLVKDSGRERPGALPEIVIIGVVVVFGVVLVIGAVVELGVVVVLVEGLNVLVETADTIRSTDGGGRQNLEPQQQSR